MNQRTRYLRPEEASQHSEALLKYRDLAVRYDARMARTERWRERAIEALELQEGQTVVDVACGTGASFDALLARIGPTGRVIGIDLSAEMLSVAEARVKSRTALNVTLVEAAAEDVQLEAKPDRALFSFAHDVLQSPRAIANLAQQLGPAARVAAVGAKRPRRWNLLLNGAMRLLASSYVTSFRNFDEPWRELAGHADLSVGSYALGAIYVASGSVRQASPGPCR